MAGNSPDAGRSVLSRALAVLGVFSVDQPEHTLASIAAGSGLSPATAYRLVGELVEWGALEKVRRGRYQVGLRLWRIGSLAPSARTLRDTALPFLQDLQIATGHHVMLGVADGTKVLSLEQLRPRGQDTLVSRVGGSMPAHASGLGKVLLAFGPPDRVREVIAQGLPKLAPCTITDPDELLRTLADIRARGYSTGREEMRRDTAAVAVPVVDPGGLVIAAVAVVVPGAVGNLQRLVPVVRVTAAAISRALGASRERFPLSERSG